MGPIVISILKRANKRLVIHSEARIWPQKKSALSFSRWGGDVGEFREEIPVDIGMCRCPVPINAPHRSRPDFERCPIAYKNRLGHSAFPKLPHRQSPSLLPRSKLFWWYAILHDNAR